MNRLLRGLLLACLSAALILTSSPAQAIGNGDPILSNPAPGSTVKSGFSGPLSFNLSNAPTGEYDIDLYCGPNYEYEWYKTFVYDGSNDYRSWTIPAIKGPKTCTVNIYGYDLIDQSGYMTEVNVYRTFKVSEPPLAKMDVYDASVSPSTFYPLVRDGHRDTTTMRYYLNQKASVTAIVTKNSTGNRVRRIELGTQFKGRHSWSWNGRNNNGDKVRAGGYTITISGRNAESSRDSVSRRVTVDTATVTRRVTKKKWGDEGARATSGNCYATRDTYYGTTDLDCWGGNYAKASYGFTLPGNAYDVTWGMNGEKTGGDVCCNGYISRDGTRTSSTHFRITATVTGWRAYEVWSARVTYSYKARI